MTATNPSLSNSSSRPTYSCVRCADRKVKCDRQRPACGACLKHKVDCVFSPTQPLRKRQKRIKVQILADRLRQCEALLQQHGIGIDANKGLDTLDSDLHHRTSQDSRGQQFHTPSSIELEPNKTLDKTQIGNGEVSFKFVENSLWTRVAEESRDPENSLEDLIDSSDLELSDGDFGYVLSSKPKSVTKPHHPPPEFIHQLWETFKENIDPLTKVLHVLTVEPAILKAARDVKIIPRSFEALMFAIYSAAIMSLTEDECEKRFSEPRKSFLSRNLLGTESALLRANFMGTTSLVVLQALVLHLFSVRDIYEPRAVWTLTGVAIRIAQVMGLERDGVSLGLPPFETEMRRRIWWVLKLHDFRTAELCGLAKFRDLDMSPERTKWPTNVDDNQLSPSMSSPAIEPKRLTDMAFVAFRCDLASFAAGRVATFRRRGVSSSQWNLDSRNDKVEIEEAFKELEETIETKYLRYCDPSQPLHLMTMLVARYGMNVVRFLTHHPRTWVDVEQTPLFERELVWNVSIKLLEQHNMAHSNPMLKRFAWHAAYFHQWHAFIHVLDTLRINPVKEDANKAWQLIGNTYDHTPGMISDMKKPIHVAVGNLCLKAYSDRETALRNKHLHLPPTPGFILQLRQRHRAAIAKRRARNAKNSQPQNISQSKKNTEDTMTGSYIEVVHGINSLESTELQRNEILQLSSLPQDSGTTESDPFSLISGFDDDQEGNSSMDFDFMFAEDFGVDSNCTETINWEQWDAWLADSNVMRPLSSSRD